MKRSIKIAVAAALALSATSAFATNGDNLIAVGAKARGMGGIGIGMSHGAESALANPAMISTVKGTEISFGGTVFMPDVKVDNGGTGTFNKSAADMSVIPEVSIAQNTGNGFYWGVGMFGTAGMGVDYKQFSGDMWMATNLQLMQFAVPLAYKTNGLTVAIAPVLQYGSLDMNYDTNGTNKSWTTGVAQDFGVGYNIGVSYEMSGLTFGASYKSSIDMVYDGILSKATAQFQNIGALTSAGLLDDHLEQPAEYGAGISYKMGASTFAFDYKQIQWGSAKGYKNFGWEDQDVYALGYEYDAGSWAARAGYNHAKSPITASNLSAPNAGTYNMLNLLAFPGNAEDHYTIGGTYAFSKQTSLDLAYVYAAEATQKLNLNSGTIEVKHSEQSVSAQLNFNF